LNPGSCGLAANVAGSLAGGPPRLIGGLSNIPVGFTRGFPDLGLGLLHRLPDVAAGVPHGFANLLPGFSHVLADLAGFVAGACRAGQEDDDRQYWQSHDFATLLKGYARRAALVRYFKPMQ
jgi:hypothetical protein